MANQHGDFVWYELMSPDPEASAVFYGQLMGWTCTPASDPSMNYREWWMEGTPIGGLLPLTEEMKSGGAQPCWMGYVHVTDINSQIEALKSAGAQIVFGPQDIPGVGRMVMILDPHGVPLYVMTDTSGQTSEAFSKVEPKLGYCAWNELSTTDPAAAWAFYGGQFGWTKGDTLDMGPLGPYDFIVNDTPIGGLMRKPDEMPVPMWSYYFRVADIDKAVQTTLAQGGTVLQPPIEIPGGDFSVNLMDPQGAPFALVGARL
jgi:uncharacterized protein